MTTPTRLRNGGGTSSIQPTVVNDGAARMYDTSVNRSENRTPATTASHTGCFLQRQSAIACASANAAHWPPVRRRNVTSRLAGDALWNKRNQRSGATHDRTKMIVSSSNAPQRKIRISALSGCLITSINLRSLDPLLR